MYRVYTVTAGLTALDKLGHAKSKQISPSGFLNIQVDPEAISVGKCLLDTCENNDNGYYVCVLFRIV